MKAQMIPFILHSHSKRKTNCVDCALSPVCLPLAVDATDLERLDSIIERRLPLQRGSVLFHEGIFFNAIYVVRSGAIKTTITQPSGLKQVTGFFLPGELVGLGSIGQASYVCKASALETTTVCVIPFNDLEGLSRELPRLQEHMFKLMSANIRGDHQLKHLLGQRPGEGRLAAFLLTLAARNKRRHLSDTLLRLPMSRSDLGNHLCLASETTSRIFARLHEQGVLQVDGKDIHILDRARLLVLADGEET